MSPYDRLHGVLLTMGRIAVAVSGGVDSLTLATAAHRILPGAVTMHHATSPAVPAEATARTRALAVSEGWLLDVFDAGEFADPAYRANPVDRCFFCKTNLYGAVGARTRNQIVSGTNLDDLGEYRPGLEAARTHSVLHPFVEAEISKPVVRALAVELGLGVLSELPSAPCLSSRVETGIRIETAVLEMVHQAEKLVGVRLSPRTVRWRVRAEAVVIELDEIALARSQTMQVALRADLQVLTAAAGVHKPIDFAAYRNGSAFLRTSA